MKVFILGFDYNCLNPEVCMSLEMILGIAGGVFLAMCGALLLATVRYGRRLLREFERQFPEQYAGAGNPWPGFLNSERRRAHFRFLMQREFETTPNSQLVRKFDGLRRAEMGVLFFMLAGFAIFGLAIFLLGA